MPVDLDAMIASGELSGPTVRTGKVADQMDQDLEDALDETLGMNDPEAQAPAKRPLRDAADILIPEAGWALPDLKELNQRPAAAPGETLLETGVDETGRAGLRMRRDRRTAVQGPDGAYYDDHALVYDETGHPSEVATHALLRYLSKRKGGKRVFFRRRPMNPPPKAFKCPQPNCVGGTEEGGFVDEDEMNVHIRHKHKDLWGRISRVMEKRKEEEQATRIAGLVSGAVAEAMSPLLGAIGQLLGAPVAAGVPEEPTKPARRPKQSAGETVGERMKAWREKKRGAQAATGAES